MARLGFERNNNAAISDVDDVPGHQSRRNLLAVTTGPRRPDSPLSEPLVWFRSKNETVFWVASLVSLILFARPDASLIVIAFTVVFGLFAGFGITVSHALWGRRLVLSEDGVTLTGYRSVPAIHASWDEVATIEVQSQKGDTRVIAFRLANKQSRRRTDYLFCARCTPQVCKEFLSFTSKLGGENTETGDNNKVTS